MRAIHRTNARSDRELLASPELAAAVMAETFAMVFESLGWYRPELGEPSGVDVRDRWQPAGAQCPARPGGGRDTATMAAGAPLVVDDEALAVIDALGDDATPAVDAFGEWSELLREAVTGRILEER